MIEYADEKIEPKQSKVIIALQFIFDGIVFGSPIVSPCCNHKRCTSGCVCVYGIKEHSWVRQNIDKINWKSTNSYCFLWALAQVAQVSLLIPDKSMTVATDQHKQGRSNVLVTIRFPKTMSGNITITLFDLFHQHRVWAIYRLHAIQSTLSDGLEYRFVMAKCTIIIRLASTVHSRRIPLKN